jgi:hypothetical protein
MILTGPSGGKVVAFEITLPVFDPDELLLLLLFDVFELPEELLLDLLLELPEELLLLELPVVVDPPRFIPLLFPAKTPASI